MEELILSILFSFAMSVQADVADFYDQFRSAVHENYRESLFVDVAGHDYESAISYLKIRKIVSGYDDGTFKPDKLVNRAEFTQIVVDSIGTSDLSRFNNCFTDVEDQWFANSVCFAYEEGLVSGFEEGNFNPSEEIKFVEALKIAFEALDFELLDLSEEDAQWYQDYKDSALALGIFDTVEKGLDKSITRGEMAEIIFKISESEGRALSGSFSNSVLGTSMDYPASWHIEKIKDFEYRFSGTAGEESGKIDLRLKKIVLESDFQDFVDHELGRVGKYANSEVAAKNWISLEGSSEEAHIFAAGYRYDKEEYGHWQLSIPGNNGEYVYVWVYVAPIDIYKDYFNIAEEMMNSWGII